MSGSSHDFSFGGGSNEKKNCDQISIRTNLASPVPAVLSTLKTGDILDIQLQGATGPLAAVDSLGNIAGTVLTIDPQLLINCINDGYSYQGRIISLSGADCQILISVKP